MKTIIVAEIGSNWEGSVSKAKKIIQECKKAGADIVKFQMWRAEDLYSKNHPNWKEIKKSELTFEKARKIKKIADQARIEFMCSVFYPEAVTFLETLNVKKYKIASRTCLIKDPHSLEVLESKALTKKPIIISMGMGGDRKKIERIFSKNKTIFCYCISEYPLEFKKIDWKEALKYDGFSDHTSGITAPILFTILKKQKKSKQILIEKHVKLKNSKGPDASTSMNTKELSELVSNIRIIENANF
ncbi:MAG: N-acetylneuraminate synthase family protein [Nitrosopumilus sp.]|uniref:N-acetylneuraminate synthase family protein n=1 Tax=Nitrosopumilus sp. TaxID=2024843 RepID=UPI0024308610|nr:N-acetylneuraminate synthase family protein [Nitrosopumilus sp.]MCV0366646.1 N-acetylneuraminate synthase family protein [Nitrosopumilus sp.]